MKNLILFTIVLLSIITISCTKNASTNKSSITFKSLNLSATATGPKFSNADFHEGIYDIPITGTSDDKLDILFYKYPSTTLLKIGASTNQEVAVDASISPKKYKIFTSGAEISSTSAGWQGSVANETGGDIVAGSGDKYVGIRVKLSDNTTHYGWMLINYASNGLTVTLKEVAYNNVANESIKAGQK